MFDVQHYLKPDGTDPFDSWFRSLKDRQAQAAINRRIGRVQQGNFGDHKFERDGVWELRFDLGPGYRVYYGMDEKEIVLLLCGGDKKSQSKDLQQATEYWTDWKRRTRP